MATETAKPRQTFRFLANCWDVDKALELVKGREPGGHVNIDSVLYGFVGEPPHWSEPDADGTKRLLSRIGLVSVDWDYALGDHINLEEPVILIPLPGRKRGETVGLFPIDGWHRIARAGHDGHTRLPAHLLTKAEEKKIRC